MGRHNSETWQHLTCTAPPDKHSLTPWPDFCFCCSLHLLCRRRCQRRNIFTTPFGPSNGRGLSFTGICFRMGPSFYFEPENTHIPFQITWTLYFTAEEGSLTLDIMNTFGTGGLTGPGRRRTVVGGGGIARSPSNGYIGGGIGGGMGGAPYSPPAAQSYGGGGGGFGNIGMGLNGQVINQENKSQYSVNNPISSRPVDSRSLGGQSTGGQSGVQTEKRHGSPTSGVGAGGIGGSNTDNPGPSLMPMPLPQPVSPPNPPTDAGNTEQSQYRARALYACG